MNLHDDLRTYGRLAREERDSLTPPDPAFDTGSSQRRRPSGTRGPSWWQYAAAATVAIAAFFGGRLSTGRAPVPPAVVTRIDTVVLDAPIRGTTDTTTHVPAVNRPAASVRGNRTGVRRSVADHAPNRFVGMANLAVMAQTGSGSIPSMGSGLRRFTTSLP